METQIDNRKKKNQKAKMTQLMRSLIVILSLIGLVSIIFLIAVYSGITKSYSKIVNEIYQDKDYMNDLSMSMYQHQNMVFKHIITSSKDKKDEIANDSNSLAIEMRQLLKQFGETTTGSKYESYYHDIYSGIVGYLKNVEIIYDFSSKGEIETAQYYMENVLEDYLVSVNNTMKTIDDVTELDMNSAKDQMNHNIEIVRVSSSIIIAVLVVFSIISQVIGYRVSDIMVNVDAETGIINYANFVERLQKKKRGSLVGCTILAINIKGFQYINQRVGAENGGQVLRQYAGVLKDKIGNNGLVARASGDGFVVIIRDEQVEEFLTFLKDVSLDIVLDSKEEELESLRKLHISIPTRCGYCSIVNDMYCQDALENATLALKLARDMSESDQIRYEENMFTNVISQNQMIHDFKSGIENKEFIVYYQPKVDININKLCGAEALVRWLHNDHIIPPMQFIPVLEKERLIAGLDLYVLEEVCRAIKQWQDMEYDIVPIAVNCSKANLRDERFADYIIDIVSAYQVDSKYIEIELTETSDFDDQVLLLEFIKKIKMANINISIDFGTKQSTLSMIKDMDVDTVKLDKLFISGIEDEHENIEDENLVSNIVHMLNDLHKNVICVGVETLKQVVFLKNAECYQVQGYLFDRPLSSEEYTNRLIHSNY